MMHSARASKAARTPADTNQKRIQSQAQKQWPGRGGSLPYACVRFCSQQI